MKLIFLVGIIFALSGVAVGLKNSICGQDPANSGPCRALIERYTYYPEQNECTLFDYGGCKGTENRFWMKAECEAKCKE